MISTLFGWFWLIANLAVLYLALTRRPGFVARSFIVGGALLGAAAGLSNGLVMTMNGFRMPVESGVTDWESAPGLFNDPDDVDSFACRLYREWDPPPDPWKRRGVHMEVPAPEGTPPGASGAPVDDSPAPFRPRLAFLDDRHPIEVCGESTLFSKGDIMGFMGVVLMLPGLALAALGFLLGKIFRKRKPAS